MGADNTYGEENFNPETKSPILMTKTLQLDLHKRILIVEYETIHDLEIEESLHKALPDIETKLICRGSELNEEIAKGFALKKMYYRTIYYKDLKDENNHFTSALDSFISAIEAKNFTWNGTNPISLDREKVYRQIGNHFTADGVLKCWNEFENNNFHSGKCLIFEIL